jgi:hypothetical protein
MTGESAYQQHLASSFEENQVCPLYLFLYIGWSYNCFRNINVKITEPLVKPMYTIRTIFVPLEWVPVLVPIMDASIHIVWWIFRRVKGDLLVL